MLFFISYDIILLSIFNNMKKSKSKTRGRAVFFAGRRTAILVNAKDRVEAIRKAKRKKKRGGDVKEVRTLSSKEKASAKTGKWLRIRPKGFKENMRGLGPKPKAS
jgi:hypothetical protein